MSILGLVGAALSAEPERPAVTDAGGCLTRGGLRATALDLAARLLARGLRPGEPVTVGTGLSRWAAAAMLGVLYAGGHYVPVDTAFPAARRRAMALAGGARLTVTEPDAPDGPGIVPIRPTPPDPTPSSALSSASSPTSWPGTEHDGLPAYAMCTSGSTGTPKTVLVPHRALAYSTEARLRYYRTAPTVFLLCSSISFDSSVAGIFWSLATGAHLVVPSPHPLDTAAIATAAARHRASHLLLLPSLYDILLADAPALASLRTVVVAGEPCPPALVRRHFAALPGAALYNEYGPAECTVWSLVHRCEPSDGEAGSVPIGRPIPGTAARLLVDGDRDAADGQVGELCVSGPGVASGAPWHRTGDLAWRDGHGLIHHAGRLDTQLKLAGMRMELSEIEHTIRERSGARQAAVGVERRDGLPYRLVAFLVAPEPGLRAPDLRSRLLGDLPRAAVPARVRVVDRLPMLPSGKLDRTALDRMAAAKDAAGPTNGEDRVS